MFNLLSKTFSSVFGSFGKSGKITETSIATTLESVRQSLLEADVPYDVATAFCTQIQNKAVGQKLTASLKPAEQFAKLVHDELVQFLGKQNDVSLSNTFPSVIVMLGLQGSGKTTTIGKLAQWFIDSARSKGKKRNILCASVDYYRPAAIDQLEIVAGQVGIDFYRSPQSDPRSAAHDIYEYYKKGHYDLLFLDTAGRLHVDEQLMDELQAIISGVKPRFKILVLDSMTGQQSLEVAKAFDSKVGFDGAILSKMDSDTRGGAAFAFRYSLGKPILFVGTGEKPGDLEQFYPDRMANRILGMGDLITLKEKADQKIKQEEQEAAYQSFVKGNFTLADFANQMNMMNRLGSLTSLMKYIPGVNSAQVPAGALEKGEREMKKFKVIIDSMTPKERRNHKILDGSRKKRIASGSGTSVHDVNILLERFEQMQQYVKLFKRFGR